MPVEDEVCEVVVCCAFDVVFEGFCHALEFVVFASEEPYFVTEYGVCFGSMLFIVFAVPLAVVFHLRILE